MIARAKNIAALLVTAYVCYIMYEGFIAGPMRVSKFCDEIAKGMSLSEVVERIHKNGLPARWETELRNPSNASRNGLWSINVRDFQAGNSACRIEHNRDVVVSVSKLRNNL